MSQSLKAQIIKDYGLKDFKGEIDHYGSRELGGTDVYANLWPQAGKVPNAKDTVENRLKREVCAGKITLKQAQQAEIKDWRKAP